MMEIPCNCPSQLYSHKPLINSKSQTMQISFADATSNFSNWHTSRPDLYHTKPNKHKSTNHNPRNHKMNRTVKCTTTTTKFSNCTTFLRLEHNILQKQRTEKSQSEHFKIKSNDTYFRSLELLGGAEDEARELGSIDAISRTARSLSCANTGRYWRPPKPLPAAKSLSSAATISTPFLSSAIALISIQPIQIPSETRGWWGQEKRDSDLRECRGKDEFDSSQREEMKAEGKLGICFSFYINVA